MNPPGAVDSLTVAARSALLDALTALDKHRDQVIVVGAQAVYLRSGQADVAIAEFTKDSDLVLDPRELAEEPLLEDAMRSAKFLPAISNQPGAWVNPAGIPVDLMVPDALQKATGSHRGAQIPPHSKRATRRTVGLEATVVDHSAMTIVALDPADPRSLTAEVAGAAGLIVAKMHKIHERLDNPQRLNNKDAHDIYRLLVAETDMAQLAKSFRKLLGDPVSAAVTQRSIDWLANLFGTPTATGSLMAGQTEVGVGDPEQVALSTSFLADDLLNSLRDH
jgi:hypothetical protein